MKLKLLYIDDEKVNLSNFQLTFEDDFEVAIFLGPSEALEWLAENQDVAIVIADQRMDGGTGLQLLEKVSQRVPPAIRILVNSYVRTNEIDAAVADGRILRCIQKPWNADDFVFTIQQACEKFLLLRQNEELRRELAQGKDVLLAARQESPEQVERITTVLPICASCKKIRDEQGAWGHVEAYIESNSGVRCSHGICPDCVSRVYPEFSLEKRLAESLVQSGKS
ncbi:response regulator [Thermodesulfobacteriota bacterium]